MKPDGSMFIETLGAEGLTTFSWNIVDSPNAISKLPQHAKCCGSMKTVHTTYGVPWRVRSPRLVPARHGLSAPLFRGFPIEIGRR
jgi:hypothetical protein